MTRSILVFVMFALVSMGTLYGCDKKDEAKSGDKADSGPNPFQLRKDAVDGYMKAVEDAADLPAAIAAGQAWLDANLESYKKNCTMLKEYQGDPQKSKMAKGIETPWDEYSDRLNKKAGGNPMEAMPLQEQFNGFFQCEAALAK